MNCEDEVDDLLSECTIQDFQEIERPEFAFASASTSIESPTCEATSQQLQCMAIDELSNTGNELNDETVKDERTFDDVAAAKGDQSTNDDESDHSWKTTICNAYVKPSLSQNEVDRIKAQRRGAPQLFVKDVLRAKTFQDEHTGQFSQYTVKGLIFENVSIRGNIVSIEGLENRRFQVCDGTATVTCKFQDQSAFNDAKVKLDDFVAKTVPSYDKTNQRQQMAFMLLNKTKKLMNRFPAPEELEVGQKVNILGNLDIYRGVVFIFIHRAEVVDDTDIAGDLKYFDHLKHLYAEVYPEMERVNAMLLKNI